jgi:hypothetical protein
MYSEYDICSNDYITAILNAVTALEHPSNTSIYTGDTFVIRL